MTDSLAVYREPPLITRIWWQTKERFRKKQPSNLTLHAERELKVAGLLGSNDEYDQAVADATLEIVKVFAKQGHSGFSASVTTSLVEKLMRFEPLGPLTGEDDEWTILDYDEDMKGQNKRCSHVFLRADGTAYDIEGKVFREPDGCCYTNGDSHMDITFPYTPTTEYVDVPKYEDS